MIKTIFLKERLVQYELIRKKVKNINLRIRRDGSIRVSANRFVSEKVIENFLVSKSDFIVRTLDKLSITRSPEITLNSGDKIKYLGKDIVLSVQKGDKPGCSFSGDTLVLCIKDVFDFDQKKKVFLKWQKAESSRIITLLCNKYFLLFKKYCADFPELSFRKMKSRWGSCNYVKNQLTFNTHLIIVPIECIEYVVVHEFAHFIEHNHSRDFYKIIEEILPDYKVRRQILKSFENKENLL